MAASPFPHFRATCYRFVEMFPILCPELMDAPDLDDVIDIHLENFGVWPDEEGRGIWGINDYDEAYRWKSIVGLVRNGCSAEIAINEFNLDISVGEACHAMERGWINRIKSGIIKPFVLAEDNVELWKMARKILKDPHQFWDKIESQVNWRAHVPADVQALLHRHMPEGTTDEDDGARTAGEGSLGRRRFVRRGMWNGGRVAREAKIALPSCCVWAKVGGPVKSQHVGSIIRERMRAHSGDPKAGVDGNWMIRRLAPNCSKIEFADLPRKKEAVLLEAMGADIANKHLATPGARSAILAWHKQLPTDWFEKAVTTMNAEATYPDFKEWRKHMKREKKS